MREYDDLSRGTTSVYERLAAMHAVVRALGGDYRSTELDRKDLFDSGNRSEIVVYAYQVDMNRLGFFAPMRREMSVFGDLVIDLNATNISIQDRNRARPGSVDFNVRLPAAFLDTYNTKSLSKFGESLPRLPDAALAERLSKPKISERLGGTDDNDVQPRIFLKSKPIG